MINRKRGNLAIFNDKRGLSHDLFFNVFELVLAFIVVLALFNYVSDIVEQTIFEKNYLARDLALLTNTIYAAPGKVIYNYGEDVSDFIVDFSENRVTVYEEGEDINNVNTLYLFAENKNIPFGPNNIVGQDVENYKLVFFKSVTGVTVEQREPMTISDTINLEDIENAEEIIAKIIEIAESRGVDPSLAIAVALHESGLRQCNDGTLNCGTIDSENVLCNAGGDCGIMQINSNVFGMLFELGGAIAYGCSNTESAFDWECNIRVGIGILVEKYSAFRLGISESTFDAVCGRDIYKTKYMSYREWDAALRGYNGWGCQTSAIANYVESVKALI